MATGIIYDALTNTETTYEYEDNIDLNTIAELMANDYKSYLTSTDWYYARKMETGDEVPEEIILKRKEARDFIREHEVT